MVLRAHGVQERTYDDCSEKWIRIQLKFPSDE